MDKINFKKKFGQNFLSDTKIIDRIIGVIDKDTTESLVIEVGPGAGILTTSLAKKFKNVLSFEIDKELKPILDKNTFEFDNINVVYEDFMNVDLFQYLNQYSYDSIFFVANVPYYITTAILTKLIESGIDISKIIMMVQKEVGDRYAAKVGSRDYSYLTVISSYYFDIKKEFIVDRKEFTPVPNVDSMIISFSKKEELLELTDYNYFEKLVRSAFKFKRKNLKNNFKDYDLNSIDIFLRENGYDLTKRAEQIPLEVFVNLSNYLMK